MRVRVFLNIVLVGLIALSVVSCKKDDIEIAGHSELHVEFQPFWENELMLDDQFAIDSNLSIQISELKFYISDLTFVTRDSQEVKATFREYPENVFLFQKDVSTSFTLDIAHNDFVEVKFLLGVDSSLNHSDPNIYSASHPLSRNQDMYWEMTNYRFLVLEGVADYPEKDSFSHHLSYHLGGDQYLRSVTLPINIELKEGQQKTLPLAFDMKRIFENIDITTFFSFHSSEIDEEKGLEMMDNFRQSFYR